MLLFMMISSFLFYYSLQYNLYKCSENCKSKVMMVHKSFFFQSCSYKVMKVIKVLKVFKIMKVVKVMKVMELHRN